MSEAATFRIRKARLPDDKPTILSFIMRLQRFEQAFEPDRRLDSSVAEEFYAVLIERIARRNGRMMIAERAAREPLGWAAAWEDENEVYVHAEERTFGYIAELYVNEEARGRGIGKALIVACEDWARERGLKMMMIGVLAKNPGAHGVYRSAGFADYATILRKYLR
jgi:GNAT superfamily N-acetyltransferase